jgi:OOP family OmpA-OmpF porin
MPIKKESKKIHFISFKSALATCLCMLVATSAMAQRSQREYIEGNSAGVNARIEVLGNRYAQPFDIGTAQSRILVYRTDMDNLPGATSIFVNDEYHTSLVRGAYSALCYSPSPVELGSRQMQVGNRPKDQLDTISALKLMPGQTHYLRVREANGRPVLQPVPAAQAQQELQGLRYQLHTVSRVDAAQECQEVAAPVVVAPVAAPPVVVTPVAVAPKQINLAADALFAFGKSDLNAISVAGRQSLDNLINRIKDEYVTVNSMRIMGHADPLGHAPANDKLSTERALTIRNYLLANGLQGTRIDSEGRGSREPVVTTCPAIPTPTSIACNQPNRRVVVEITGAARQ